MTDEQLANCPVLILGNKIDRPGAAGEEELRQLFGLYGQTTGKGKVSRAELHGRPLELFMCSVLKRQGYGEGFRYIRSMCTIHDKYFLGGFLNIWISPG